MSVFDRYIHEICSAPHHLTAQNKDKLRELLPLPATPDEITDTGNLLEMGKVLQKLVRIAERMYTDAISQTGEDASGDMKAAANALKQALDVAVRHAEKINAADRAIKVENALVGALHQFAEDENLPHLVPLFNTRLKSMLE